MARYMTISVYAMRMELYTQLLINVATPAKLKYGAGMNLANLSA